MVNRKLRKQLIEFAPIAIVVLFLCCCLVAGAEEIDGTVQDIDNESSNVGFNLNSQIREDGKAKKQGIKNVHSNCNININRNTYKFYYVDNTKKQGV